MFNYALFLIGIILVFFGFFLVFLALILSFWKGAKKEVKGGGAIIIGPFPIIFGTDKESVKTVLVLSIVLMTFTFLVFLVFYLLSR